jgi:hypothetical protein
MNAQGALNEQCFLSKHNTEANQMLVFAYYNIFVQTLKALSVNA